MTDLSRDAALARDAGDPLASYVDRFVLTDPDLVYLDGNSLGRLPKPTVDRMRRTVEHEWGDGLIRSWSQWMDLPVTVGDLIGSALLGAAPGQVSVSDSTSVNLYKLAAAALDARPGRRVIVTDDDNFPTDRYVLQGLAEQRGLDLRLVHTDIDEGISYGAVADAVRDDVALLCLSHVAYRSGALADMAALSALAHDAGALVLWDLSHAAGSVPVLLDADGADLAVGCTYKYLCGGPGAPAFLYVRRELQRALRSPIQGWFAQRDQFTMAGAFDPVETIGRFLVGSPPILQIAAVEEGARLLAEAGIDALRAKGVALTSYLIELADAWLAPLGFRVACPRDPARRGSHVSLHHPQAWQISQALIAKAGVVPDYRTPERLRLGPAPLSTRYVDVWEGLDRLRRLVESGAHEEFSAEPARVT
jgi:kynureninase